MPTNPFGLSVPAKSHLSNKLRKLMLISETGYPRLFPSLSQTLPGSFTVVPSAERTVPSLVRLTYGMIADKQPRPTTLMDSLLEVLPSSQSSSTSARPTSRLCGHARVDRDKKVENAKHEYMQSSHASPHCLPGPAADDFTPDNTILPYNPSTPDSSHIFLILPLFLLSLTLALLQQEMYPRSRMFLPTRPSSSLDIRSNKFLTFRNPCFRYTSD